MNNDDDYNDDWHNGPPPVLQRGYAVNIPINNEATGYDINAPPRGANISRNQENQENQDGSRQANGASGGRRRRSRRKTRRRSRKGRRRCRTRRRHRH